MVEEKPSFSQHDCNEANGADDTSSDNERTEGGIKRQRRVKKWVKEQIKWEKSLPKGYPFLSKRQKMLAAMSEIS